MSHELEIDKVTNNGFFSVKEKPWHKLGHVLDNPPTAQEAIRLAGLDWEVGKKQLYTSRMVDNNPEIEPASGLTVVDEQVDAFATYRKDTGAILGVVGPRFEPLQNVDAFDFFNPFIESGLASLETAGCLFAGKRLFITAKINMPDSVIVPQSDDRVEKFILLSNGHDGSTGVRIGFTPIRVVCNNTLTMAVQDGKSSLIRVKHGKNVKANVEALRDTMNLVNQRFEATAEVYRQLAGREINQEDLKKAIKIIFNVEKTESEFEKTERESRTLAQVIELFESGRGNYLQGVRGTRWAAYNAVTEYLQYYRGRSDENRFNSVWFGDGDKISKRAIETLLTV
jgi:phage/plasmid-like protein (TIGR03299 family)